MNALTLLPLTLAIALSACGQKQAQHAEASPGTAAAAPVAATAPPAPAPAAAPAAAAEPAAPSTAPAAGGGDLALGEKVYGANCIACHGAGVLGAPKFGDKTAWGPRIAQGKETLYTHALNGFKMMPARGGNAALKDEEVKAAIDYMASKAG